ncbi:SRPBCC family protein [Oceanobacillus longus]|uniref:SRPBCC family protein n=1 Tax=Oceanobacillus longus TaxID=930120 RepID=A0ABV8GTN3_9BACI
MKEWSKDIEIDAPIEVVWSYLDGSSLDKMKQIMPQVVDQKPVKITDEVVGSVYRQKYKEGKRIEEYDVETLEYSNTTDEKRLKVGFTLANMFEITALYELKKITDNKTYFKYTTTNNPLKWFIKLFLVFASDKVVVQFIERVRNVAESKTP